MTNVLELYSFKLCPKCKTNLHTSEFSNCKTNKDGLAWMCRACNKLEKTARYEKDTKYWKKYNNALSPKEKILKNIRSSGSKRNIVVDLTLDDIPTIPLFCPILGIEIAVGHKNRSQAVSVDRIDNTKGYVKDNIVLISHRANSHKNDMSFEQIEKLYHFYKQFQKE